MKKADFRAMPVALALCLLVSLSACRFQPQPLRMAGASPMPAPPPPVFCALKTVGAQIQTPNGQAITLHGVDLPSIKEMEADTQQSIEARLKGLAAAGAQLVRLPITDQEFSAPFIPEKVLPLSDMANQLGMVVVLTWQQPTENKSVDTQAEEIEDWLRISVVYFADRPGVWFDPFGAPFKWISSFGSAVEPNLGKQRAIAQRMADVLNGYRYKNVLLVRNPIWLLDGNAEHAKPISGNNVIYGTDDLNALPKYPTDQLPFFWLSLDDAAKAPANLSTIAPSTAAPSSALQDFWQAQQKVDLRTCAEK